MQKYDIVINTTDWSSDKPLDKCRIEKILDLEATDSNNVLASLDRKRILGQK